jgi:hypothetical protein
MRMSLDILGTDQAAVKAAFAWMDGGETAPDDPTGDGVD